MNSPAPISFSRCVLACWGNAEFMAHYRRLRGVKLGITDTKDPIAAMIDKAAGAPVIDPVEAREFFDFVRDRIWLPIVTGRVR